MTCYCKNDVVMLQIIRSVPAYGKHETWKELEQLGMTEDLSKKGMLRSGKHFSIFTIFVGLKSVFSRIRT